MSPFSCPGFSFLVSLERFLGRRLAFLVFEFYFVCWTLVWCRRLGFDGNLRAFQGFDACFECNFVSRFQVWGFPGTISRVPGEHFRVSKLVSGAGLRFGPTVPVLTVAREHFRVS